MVLLNYIKRIRQLPVKIGYPFYIDSPSIKTLLEDWLKIEIADVRARKKAYDPQQLTISGQIDNKLETTLSVNQLAYFIKVLKNTDILSNNVATQMLQTVTQTFKTKKMELITLQSIYNKYHSPEYNTTESVRQLILKMVNYIEKSRNEI